MSQWICVRIVAIEGVRLGSVAWGEPVHWDHVREKFAELFLRKHASAYMATDIHGL